MAKVDLVKRQKKIDECLAKKIRLEIAADVLKMERRISTSNTHRLEKQIAKTNRQIRSTGANIAKLMIFA